MQTNYYMYSEGTMGGIFMDFLQFKILLMIQNTFPQRTIFKGSFPAIENVFQERGVKTACSLQLANTDPVPDCLGPHPRYCVFVRKRIRFGALLPTTAARKRSKT